MARRALAGLAIAALTACAAETGGPTAEPRTIPAPPPSPTAEIPPDGRPARLDTAHASACTIAIFSEVPAAVGGVERIQADDASLTEYPAEGSRIRVTGAGRFYRPDTDWQPFRFDCVYDTAASAIAEFEVVPI